VQIGRAGLPVRFASIVLGQDRQRTLVLSADPMEAILRTRLTSSFWGIVRVVDGAFCPSSL
jgi:hypothetical protein